MTTTLCIDLTDAEGHATGRTVPVVVEYATIPYEYGTDADGHRGEMRYEREVLGVCLDHRDVRTLTPRQVEQVIVEAQEQCMQRRRT
jgi:hypothetical protein